LKSYYPQLKKQVLQRSLEPKVVLCVRWYLRYKLSLRDLVEMMAEHGLSLAHTTIMRCVRRFTRRSLSGGIGLRGPLSQRDVCEDPWQMGLSLPCR
jgi:hypothetical protein